MQLHQQMEEQNALEGKHRTDGKIDPAGNDDDSHADAEDAVQADEIRLVVEIRRERNRGFMMATTA